MKVSFPVKHKISKSELQKLKKKSYPVSITSIKQLICDFLQFKLENGTDQERKVYAGGADKKNLNVEGFINRLITNRPLTFMGRGDKWLLKNGNAGFGGFKEIGTNLEKGDLILKNLISYDEMAISAFISMSNSTKFYNDGNRYNCGKPDESGNFEPYGIYIAQVGARFEERFYMDWKFIIVDPEQNIRENGYGQANYSMEGYYLRMWANFYNVGYFPCYEEVHDRNGTSDRFVTIPGHTNNLYFDIVVYKQRIRYNALVFLAEANRRAKKVNKKAFCHVVGLGLGVWKLHPDQEQWTIEVYLELLGEYIFDSIDTLYFAWMNLPEDTTEINGISLKCGKREPAEPLNDPTLLLVCNYAWDSNSYPGNEYFFGKLSASGDPAAASCSTISYTQFPELNDNISFKHMKFIKI